MSSKWDSSITDPTERAKFDQAILHARKVGPEAFMKEMDDLTHHIFTTDAMRLLMGGLAVYSEAFDVSAPGLSFVEPGVKWRVDLRLFCADPEPDSQTPTT